MNKLSIYILSCTLLYSTMASSQGMKIMPGTTFKLTGGSYDIVLNGGANFENNSALQSSQLSIKATGSGSSQIKGSGTLGVGQILMNKSAGQSLQLLKNVNVASNVTFTSGLLDLNGNNLLLADTALLLNESEASRVIGSIGGSVQIQANLNAPLAENPGNLGLIITSGANWGNTVIRRGHNAFTNGGGGSSITRNFVVIPTNNSGLGAFLRITYRDAELNGLDENTLDFFHSTDNGVQWTNIGSVSRNTTQNFVNMNGIQSLSLLTLSTTNNPLPLTVTDMTATCEQNKATLQWRTSLPQETSYFRIRKSKDGVSWENASDRIETQANPEYLYRFTDPESPYPFYRLESLGFNGTEHYAPVQSINCMELNTRFSLSQNPVLSAIKINIESKSNTETTMSVFDLQGRLLMTQPLSIIAGQTTVSMDAGRLSSGIYHLRINGQKELLWQVKFVKQ